MFIYNDFECEICRNYDRRYPNFKENTLGFYLLIIAGVFCVIQILLFLIIYYNYIENQNKISMEKQLSLGNAVRTPVISNQNLDTMRDEILNDKNKTPTNETNQQKVSDVMNSSDYTTNDNNLKLINNNNNNNNNNNTDNDDGIVLAIENENNNDKNSRFKFIITPRENDNDFPKPFLNPLSVSLKTSQSYVDSLDGGGGGGGSGAWVWWSQY